MSEPEPPKKVVELSAAAGKIPLPRVHAALRGTSVKRLGALLASLYESVDDALFDMAERAGDNRAQSHYFEGMREIRRRRPAAEAAFIESLNRQLADLEAGRIKPAAASPEKDAERGALALVEESELEESLAINAMSDKAGTRLQRPLYALQQRLDHLAGGGGRIDADNNPIGPRQLALGFAASIRSFEIDLSVRLIVLKLFERHLLANLETYYDECNALLVQAGVLPELRYAVAMNRRPDPAPRPAAGGAAVSEAQAALEQIEQQLDGQPEQTDRHILELVTELRGLLAARHGGASRAGPAAPGGGAGGGGASARELLNALSLMQGQLRGDGGAIPAAPADSGTVKRQLLDTVRSFGGHAAPGQLGADEATIDLVGMMFDYAVQDRNLPAPVQAQLGRLQIPYLKIALMDREFIAQRSHPARRLLDQLADACVGWSAESDKDGRLLGKVQETVDTLLREFDDDPAVFERLSGEFAEFVDRNRKRAELLERRAAEAASGRERLETAQRAAAREILSRLSGRNLPSSVRELLTRRWSNYLVLTRLRHGEDSPEWRAATRFIDDFAWSVEPKKDDNDRLRLREMTPEIERLLKQGLAATGLHEGHLDELWSEVNAIYRAQTDAGAAPAGRAPQAPGAAAAPSGVDDESALTIRFASSKPGDEVVFSSESVAAPADGIDAATLEALDAWIKIARALKTGTWFEFVKDDGSRERAKLLWISTIKALYLFVNRNGLKIAEKTATELAEELKDQKAVILEQVALVDRALDAILKQLKGKPEGEASAAPSGPPAAAAASAARDGGPAAAPGSPVPAKPADAPAPAAAAPARQPFSIRPVLARPPMAAKSEPDKS